MHTYGCHLPVQARLTKYVTSETETHRHPHCGEEPSESLAAWRMARVAPTRTAARHGAPQHTRRRQTRLTPAASAGYTPTPGRAAPQQEFCSALTITVPRTHTTTLNAHSERNDSSRSRFKLEVRRVRPTRTAPTPQATGRQGVTLRGSPLTFLGRRMVDGAPHANTNAWIMALYA